MPFELGQHIPVLRVFGEVQSQRSLDIRPAIGGTVTELHPNFQNGGSVLEGDVLLRIDPSNAQTALALVQADMADAEADLREAMRALDLAKDLSLIHISEPTRLRRISYAVFCLKKKKKENTRESFPSYYH